MSSRRIDPRGRVTTRRGHEKNSRGGLEIIDAHSPGQAFHSVTSSGTQVLNGTWGFRRANRPSPSSSGGPFSSSRLSSSRGRGLLTVWRRGFWFWHADGSKRGRIRRRLSGCRRMVTRLVVPPEREQGGGSERLCLLDTGGQRPHLRVGLREVCTLHLAVVDECPLRHWSATAAAEDCFKQ